LWQQKDLELLFILSVQLVEVLRPQGFLDTQALKIRKQLLKDWSLRSIVVSKESILYTKKLNNLERPLSCGRFSHFKKIAFSY